MANSNFVFEAEPREMLGKGASRRLRREDKVLAIIYGGDEAPQPIQLAHHHVLKGLEGDVYSKILTMNNAGKKQKVVLKDIQRHPFKPRIVHMDFLRIDENKPLTMHVPIRFIGEKAGPGVFAGGTVTHYMVEVEVRCLPANLPDHFDIDLTNAPLDTVVHLSHLDLPNGVELVHPVHNTDDDLPIVAIHLPKRSSDTDEETAAPAAGDVPATNVKKPEAAKAGGKEAAKPKAKK